jgi:peptidyl-prolyl cis-trans isomerase SurA
MGKMKAAQKIILTTIGLVALMYSCEDAAPGLKPKEPTPVDSIAPTKSLEDPQRTEAEAKSIIDGLYKHLVNGEDFAKLATLYSEDPGTKLNGGRYDSVRKDIFVPEFEKVVFDLELNEISTPFVTEYGYHIATVIAIRGDERDVRHVLIRYKK